jgi:hypothetical protein
LLFLSQGRAAKKLTISALADSQTPFQVDKACIKSTHYRLRWQRCLVARLFVDAIV